MITIDFESRSTSDLLKEGGYKYSLDPTTEVLCMAFIAPPLKPYLWHPDLPSVGVSECELSRAPRIEVLGALEGVFQRILEGELIEAHNAFFEKCIWSNKMVPEYKWPKVKPEQWRCSASRASMCALPRSLGEATKALGLPLDKQKSADGKKLMMRMCKPRKPTAKQAKELKQIYGTAENWPIIWNESRDMFQGLFDYCIQDTISEEALSNALPPLSPPELRLWQVDQRINWRGVYFDAQMVEEALKLIDLEVEELNAELAVVSDGALLRGSQRAALKTWVCENSPIQLPDTQGKTIKRILADKKAVKCLTPQVKRVLEISVDINRSSTAKYKGMSRRMVPDQRIRDMLMYHGAGTGRWTGKGIQPHNFPRGSLKPKMSTLAAELIRVGDRDLIKTIWEGDLSTMEVLSSALRGAIMAAPGKELIVADYSSIEARVLIWLVDDKPGLEVFFSGQDIYKDMAVSIYHIAYEDVDDEQRRMGKQAILGLGYQMGWKKFKFTLWDSYNIDITKELAQLVTDSYRARYIKVKNFWSHIERCAIKSVQNPGRAVRVNDKLMFKFSNGFLNCKLPSGRMLYYRDPKIVRKKLPWGDMTDALTYMSVDGYTNKWVRTDTYGGKLTENVVQAIARDFMGYAIDNIDQTNKYEVILSVHDELLAECDEGLGDYTEFEDAMAALPDWGKGCPVAAEGWQGIRYRK